jgi:hypothetical protein
MPERSAPNFLVAGAAKSGTTSLTYYLEQHPDVYMARPKECHFLLTDGRAPGFSGPGDEVANNSYVTDLDAYGAMFSGVGDETAVGEASVFYLYRPESFRRALELDPAMRVVVILRDPVERAFSAYTHLVRWDRETLSFGDALDAEPSRVQRNWEYCWHYVAVSRYLPQLQRLFEIVPRSQVKILLQEELSGDPSRTMSGVFSFLGVDDDFSAATSLRLNASGAPRSRALHRLIKASEQRWNKPLKRVVPRRLGVWAKESLRNLNLRRLEMAPEDRARLHATFSPEVDRLQDLLGRDLTRWMDPSTPTTATQT